MIEFLKTRQFKTILLGSIPILIVLWIWFSALAFVPVPWPDDSAFYFVARELFRWPPRWVMLPQAPFEPTYRIFNFNTMPLYPILIGLGRFVGIDGSFLLKIWPLGAFAISGSVLACSLYRNKLPFLGSLLIALVFALDPGMRWASVLVRPESLIGLFGVILVLGLTLGFPKRFEPQKAWDPVAALLALGAYCHFNAVHLVFPVFFAFALQPKRLMQIGYKTLLYLSPWILVVLFHWNLFVTQMTLQWSRLNVPNYWLSSPSAALSNVFQSMGSPESWPSILEWPAMGMWLIVFIALVSELIIPFTRQIVLIIQSRKLRIPTIRSSSLRLLPAAGWILGATWLFHSKPEVWFTYYFHAAIWCFTGLAALKLWQSKNTYRLQFLFASSILISAIAFVFGSVNYVQSQHLGQFESWHWETYYNYIDCVDHQLTNLQEQLGKDNLGNEKPFRVWCPTFPDITIELSRRHPKWELTRTNDFWYRSDLAVQHGWDTEAVVVPETVNWAERTVSAKPEDAPGITSSWMLWKDYFLNRLWVAPGWKPNRYICQRGRWQAFIFMKDPKASK